MLFIYYLLFLLNNTKITSFKFDLAYYLDSVGISNEDLNIMINLKMIIILKVVDQKKKIISDVYEKYVKNALGYNSENVFILNVNNYYNIHI